MPRAGRLLCEAVQQMVMGAMQIEAIRRREEVITLHLPAYGRVDSQIGFKLPCRFHVVLCF